MGSNPVVVLPPLFQFLSRIFEREEETHIQAFIPQPTIKALDISVLYWLAWPNEVQIDSMTIRPRIHGATGEFAAVIYGDRPRNSAFSDDAF